eukprot:1190656-Ditylum_brightwellii.AAC.1
MQQRNGKVAIDLNSQNVHVKYENTRLSTHVLVISSLRVEKSASKSCLFALEQGRINLWPKTFDFTFVPFVPEGKVTADMITAVVRAKNNFLGSQTSIAITGIKDVDLIVRDKTDAKGETL